MNRETILTNGPGGRILTNANVWSADGQWIVFDTRSDPAGAVFDGRFIRAVNVASRGIRTLLNGRRLQAFCGVATCHPTHDKAVCMVAPMNPTPDWSYGPSRREGIMFDIEATAQQQSIDARDMVPPFTPGALRGGTHLHICHPWRNWISFTYEDEVLKFPTQQRNVGISVMGRPGLVPYPYQHPRNHNGDAFSFLVTTTSNDPRIDSDEISRACEEGWIGETSSLAFQGTVHTKRGPVVEAFVVDVPEGPHSASDGPLEGTEHTLPAPPRGVVQRRLTRTAHLKFPGLQGPRHWLRSSPDGSKIGCFMKDDRGIAQFWIVDPRGGEPRLVTDSPAPMASAFTWHPDGQRVACVVDGSVSLIDTGTGTVTRLTAKIERPPRPEACVFSPDGKRIAFVRTIAGSNRICCVEVG